MVRPQDFAASPQNHIIANLAPEFATETHIRVKRAQTHTLKNHHIAADPPRPDDATDRMSKKNARTNLTFGSNFQPKQNKVHVG